VYTEFRDQNIADLGYRIFFWEPSRTMDKQRTFVILFSVQSRGSWNGKGDFAAALLVAVILSSESKATQPSVQTWLWFFSVSREMLPRKPKELQVPLSIFRILLRLEKEWKS